MAKKDEESTIKIKDEVRVKLVKDDVVTNNDELPEEKRKFILEIIKVRLEGIGEATKRARITFIISIIASCSMLITLFNTYYSWTQTRGFDSSFKYKAEKIIDEDEFIKGFEKQNNKDILFKNFDADYKCLDTNQRHKLCDIKAKLESINNETDVTKKEIKISELVKSSSDILRLINERFLNDIHLYEQIDGEMFYKWFVKNKEEETSAERKKKGENLKNKITKIAYNKDNLGYYDPTNHLNKLILQKIFPEIEWKGTVQDLGTPISLYEENKRALSKEWIENQNVRINLLGIAVNVDQFSLIGSFTLMVISIWMLFSFRRENRSIVSLLRDVKKYVKFPKNFDVPFDELKPKEEDLLHDNWKIADLTLHGIAHNLIFAQTGKNDLPMSEAIIFDNQSENNLFGNITEIITKLIRKLSYILIFLPVISILVILWVDYLTTTEIIYPYSNNPIEYFINRNIPDFPNQITKEIRWGIFFLVVTFGVTFSCIMFQRATAIALRTYEKQLGKEIDQKDSWWESIRKKLKRSPTNAQRIQEAESGEAAKNINAESTNNK